MESERKARHTVEAGSRTFVDHWDGSDASKMYVGTLDASAIRAN